MKRAAGAMGLTGRAAAVKSSATSTTANSAETRDHSPRHARNSRRSAVQAEPTGGGLQLPRGEDRPSQARHGSAIWNAATSQPGLTARRWETQPSATATTSEATPRATPNARSRRPHARHHTSLPRPASTDHASAAPPQVLGRIPEHGQQRQREDPPRRREMEAEREAEEEAEGEPRPPALGPLGEQGEEHERHGGDAQIQARQERLAAPEEDAAGSGPIETSETSWGTRASAGVAGWTDQDSLASSRVVHARRAAGDRQRGRPHWMEASSAARAAAAARGIVLLTVGPRCPAASRATSAGGPPGPTSREDSAEPVRAWARERQCQQGHLACATRVSSTPSTAHSDPGQPGDAAEMRDERSGRDDGARHRRTITAAVAAGQHAHPPAPEEREHSRLRPAAGGRPPGAWRRCGGAAAG